MRTIHTSTWAIGISAGLALAALGVGACGNSGNGGGGSGGAGSTSTTSHSATTSVTTSTGSDTTSSTTSGTGGMAPCVEITLGDLKAASGDGKAASFISSISPDQGDATDPDGFELDFFGSAYDPMYDGEHTGTFDLSMGADNNYSTCSRCLTLLEDPTSTGTTFFQKSGTLTVDSSAMQLTGVLTGTLTDVTLIEVTIDDSYVSTPVPGGACLHIASATLTANPPPAAWACDWSYYGDGSCDCGCGIKDTDCADSMVASCDYCDDTGSCNTDTCPGTINPTDNSTCTATATDGGAPDSGASDGGASDAGP